jgi:3-phytase
VVLDANAEHVLPVLVDWQAGTLAAQPPFPAPPFGIEAACLYRDAQQIDHLFVIGKDGQAEQWLMHGDQRRGTQAGPAAAHQALPRDDAAHRLLVNENSVGCGRTTPMPKACLSASC